MDDGDATITFTYSDYKNPYYNMMFPASAFYYIDIETYMLFNMSSKLPSKYIWEARAYGDYEYEETEISVFDSEDDYPTEVYEDGVTYTITYISE